MVQSRGTTIAMAEATIMTARRSVCPAGPTDWVETPPYGKQHAVVRHEIECATCLKRTCPLGHHNCMKRVEVAEVLKACLDRLG